MADVYKVAVSIALRTNAAQVLGVLGKDLLGIKLKATEAEASLSRVGAAVLGIGGIAAGSAVLASMIRLVEHGREFVHQQSLMAQAGISQVDIANATAAAWKTAGDVIGSSAEKNLALIADLRNRLGSMTEAVQAAPSMSRLGVVLQNLTGQDQEKAGDAAARFLEQRGSLVDPKTGQISRALLENGGNLVAAISAGTRGRVGPDQLLAFQTYARLAGAQLSEQGLLNMVPIIGASRSASSVGTQLSSLENQLIGGVMTNASAHWLERLGVVDAKRVHEGRGGRMQFDAGALVDAELLRRDPREWLHRYLGGGLLKEGYATGDAQAGAVLQSHLRSTVTGLIGEILRSYAAFAKDSTLLDASVKTNQFAVAQATDPTTKMAAFSTAWQNLLTSLGAPLVNDATGAIGKLTGALTRLTSWTSAHPRAVENIELAVTALGGLAVVGGAITVASAALGPFVSGAGLLVGVLGGAGVVAAGATLASFATGIAAIGVALAGLPPLMGWLAHQIGPVGDPRANSAGRGHAGPVMMAPPSAHTPYARGNYHPTSFDGEAVHLQPINNTIVLDGHVLARSMNTHLVRLMRPSAMQGTTSWDPISTPTPPGLVTA